MQECRRVSFGKCDPIRILNVKCLELKGRHTLVAWIDDSSSPSQEAARVAFNVAFVV